MTSAFKTKIAGYTCEYTYDGYEVELFGILQGGLEVSLSFQAYLSLRQAILHHHKELDRHEEQTS